jgi:hypothetical protein
LEPKLISPKIIMGFKSARLLLLFLNIKKFGGSSTFVRSFKLKVKFSGKGGPPFKPYKDEN